MTEGGEQVIFLPLPLPTFSCYYTCKPWKEPISQLHKPLPAVRYVPESPSKASVKSRHPTCSFPHRCQLVRHLHRRAFFWCGDSFPCPIHSRVCPRSSLHSLACFTDTLAVLGCNQRLFIYGYLEAVFPPPPSMLAHTPTPLICSCMEIVHYNAH